MSSRFRSRLRDFRSRSRSRSREIRNAVRIDQNNCRSKARSRSRSNSLHRSSSLEDHRRRDGDDSLTLCSVERSRRYTSRKKRHQNRHCAPKRSRSRDYKEVPNQQLDLSEYRHHRHHNISSPNTVHANRSSPIHRDVICVDNSNKHREVIMQEPVPGFLSTQALIQYDQLSNLCDVQNHNVQMKRLKRSDIEDENDEDEIVHPYGSEYGIQDLQSVSKNTCTSPSEICNNILAQQLRQLGHSEPLPHSIDKGVHNETNISTQHVSDDGCENFREGIGDDTDSLNPQQNSCYDKLSKFPPSSNSIKNCKSSSLSSRRRDSISSKLSDDEYGSDLDLNRHQRSLSSPTCLSLINFPPPPQSSFLARDAPVLSSSSHQSLGQPRLTINTLNTMNSSASSTVPPNITSRNISLPNSSEMSVSSSNMSNDTLMMGHGRVDSSISGAWSVCGSINDSSVSLAGSPLNIQHFSTSEFQTQSELNFQMSSPPHSPAFSSSSSISTFSGHVSLR